MDCDASFVAREQAYVYIRKGSLRPRNVQTVPCYHIPTGPGEHGRMTIKRKKMTSHHLISVQPIVGGTYARSLRGAFCAL